MLQRFFIGLSSRARIAALVVTMGAIYGADRFLAALEQRELGAEARHYAEEGHQDLLGSRRKEAIEAFRRAHDTERENRAYTLGLVDALLYDNQANRAVDLLDELLDEDSNDGAANLLMARAMLETHQYSAADAYYHRAIYGTWGSDEKQKVVAARLELVKSLSQRKADQSLLAELIPLEQEAGSDAAVARQIPALYLRAGSIGHAESAYRALLKREPGNGEAYGGLAQVEMEKGNFHLAHQAFLQAAKAQPGNAAFPADADAALKAMELDPTSRRLDTTEKLARSTQILNLVIGATQPCADPGQADLLNTATGMLSAKQPKTPNNEMAEARLDLAQRIWQNRPASCQTNPETTELLNALVHKISQ